MITSPIPLIPANAGTRIANATGQQSSTDRFAGQAVSSLIWAPAFAGVSGVTTEGLAA